MCILAYFYRVSLAVVAGGALPQAFHAAFLFPIICLAMSIVLYVCARDYWEKGS